jgi:hypothetical protein
MAGGLALDAWVANDDRVGPYPAARAYITRASERRPRIALADPSFGGRRPTMSFLKTISLAGTLGLLCVSCDERRGGQVTEAEAKEEAREAGRAVGDAARKVGETVKEAAEGVKEGIGGSGENDADIGKREGVIHDGEGPIEERR